MADTEAQKEVESTVEEKKEDQKVEEKEKSVETIEKEDAKVEENGDKAENDLKKGKKEFDEKSEESKEELVTDKCCIKRKSMGADAVDGKKEEPTPGKKAKIDESPAEESNGEVAEAEAAA